MAVKEVLLQASLPQAERADLVARTIQEALAADYERGRKVTVGRPKMS